MQIRLVLPRTTLIHQTAELKTYFWLECTPEEAKDVLLASTTKGETFDSILAHIQDAEQFLASGQEDDFPDEFAR